MKHSQKMATADSSCKDPDSTLAEALRQSLQMNNVTSSNEPAHSHVKKSQDGGTILKPIYIPTPSGNDTCKSLEILIRLF